jgi:hypothetical protein
VVVKQQVEGAWSGVDAVNIYFTATRIKRVDLTYRERARTSSRPPHQVPMIPREEACTTREFQQGIHNREAQVRTGNSRKGGGPNRRPQKWSKPLPTSRPSLLEKDQNKTLEPMQLPASVILGGYVVEWLSQVERGVLCSTACAHWRAIFPQSGEAADASPRDVWGRRRKARLSSAREHDLWTSVDGRGGAQSAERCATPPLCSNTSPHGCPRACGAMHALISAS